MGSRRNGIHLAAVFCERYRRCKARELLGERGFLHLRAEARRLGEAGTAALDAGELALRVNADRDFDGATKAGHRDLRDMACHIAGCVQAAIAIIHRGAIRNGNLFKARCRRQHLSARSSRSKPGLLCDRAFRQRVRHAERTACNKRNHAENYPSRNLFHLQQPSFLFDVSQ